MSQRFAVDGLEELNRKLAALPAKIEKNIVRSMARAGAQVVRNASIENLPQGQKDDVLVKPSRSRSRERGAVVFTVGNDPKQPQLRWLETGTAPHVITIKRARVLADGEAVYGVKVNHPGQPPRPWLRPAFDQNVDKAIEAMRQVGLKRIAKEAAKK